MKRLSLILGLAVAVTFVASGIAWAGGPKTYTLGTSAKINAYVLLETGVTSLTFTGDAVAPRATGWYVAKSGDVWFHFATNVPNVLVEQRNGSGVGAWNECDLRSGSDRLPTGYRFWYSPLTEGVGGNCYWDYGSVATHTEFSPGGDSPGDAGWFADNIDFTGPHTFAQDKIGKEPFEQASDRVIYPRVAMYRDGLNDSPGTYSSTITFTFSW